MFKTSRLGMKKWKTYLWWSKLVNTVLNDHRNRKAY